MGILSKLFGGVFGAQKARSRPAPTSKPLGAVTHYYGHIGVAIVKFAQPVAVGAQIRIYGATTDFDAAIDSMQYEHKPIASAKKGQEVGIKVSEKVREGDEVFGA